MSKNDDLNAALDELQATTDRKQAAIAAELQRLKDLVAAAPVGLTEAEATAAIDRIAAINADVESTEEV